MASRHAQWRNPDLRARWGAARAPAVEGVGAAISVWIAGEGNRVFGQEPTEVGGKFSVFQPLISGRPLGTSVEISDGRKNVEAH